jgi:beta-mannosidase
VPREHLELVTEFGAQALPRRATLESFIPPQDLFPPNWTAYARRGLQPGLMLTRVTPRGDLDQFIAETQAYQAHVVRYHVEFYRRHKFRPCNGAHVFTFTDCWPAISWALVEYDRTPKAAYSALQRSMAPLQAFLAPPEPVTRHDRASPLTVCIVNDTREDFPSGTCRIDIRTAAGDPVLTHSVDCAVSSLGLTDLEPVWWTAAEPGDYSLRLAFYDSGDRERCCNEYRLRVSPPAPDGSPPAVDLIPPLVKGGVGSASAS